MIEKTDKMKEKTDKMKEEVRNKICWKLKES